MVAEVVELKVVDVVDWVAVVVVMGVV